jgi:wee1-like protein kinase
MNRSMSSFARLHRYRRDPLANGHVGYLMRDRQFSMKTMKVRVSVNFECIFHLTLFLSIEEGAWTSGELFRFDPHLSRSGSPTALSGGEAGRLSFGVLDLSGTSDPTLENSAASDLSIESPQERSDNDHSLLSHSSPKSRLDSSGRRRAAQIDSSPEGRNCSKASDRSGFTRSSSSPARRLNGSNASMISSMGTVLQSHRPQSKSPVRESSPLHPQRLFNSGGQTLSPHCESDSDGSEAVTGIALFGPPSQPPPRAGSPAAQRQNPFLRREAAGRPAPAEARGAAAGRPGPLTVRSCLHDFYNFQEIGRGSFGRVYRCVRRIDLCPYAVKEVAGRFRTERDKERALREIYALATQGDNVHVVRYYNAWEQDDRLYIQMELCSGTLAQLRRRGGPLGEAALLDVLVQLGAGLAFMHAHGLAHLDIKPDNVYTTERGIYKLGDFGLVAAADARGRVEEEGDRRYLSREVLQEEACDLFKADVFALGASAYEAASAEPLPAQGEAYHALRAGRVPPLPPAIGAAAQALVCGMMHPDPAARPSAVRPPPTPSMHAHQVPSRLDRDVSLTASAFLRKRRFLSTQGQKSPCPRKDRNELPRPRPSIHSWRAFVRVGRRGQPLLPICVVMHVNLSIDFMI